MALPTVTGHPQLIIQEYHKGVVSSMIDQPYGISISAYNCRLTSSWNRRLTASRVCYRKPLTVVKRHSKQCYAAC
jgi:hypothetical protein